MKKKTVRAISLMIFIIIIIQSATNAQTISFGTSLGGGTISGETPSIGSFSSSIFIERVSPFEEDISFRLSFFYMQDINKLLPDTRKVYFSFQKGISLKAILTQRLDNSLFIEEGLGLISLNDRTLSSTDEWDYGVNVSLSGGFDLRDDNLNGLRIGAGIEFGITFFNTLARYSSISVILIHTF